MRLEQLEYVEAVARYGSMNAAASKLHVSQQNISKSIKQMEEEMQTTIFTRSKKGAYPSKQGELVCDFAAEQMMRFRKLKEDIYALQRSKISGTINIATMNSGSCMIIPELLCDFYKSYPNVRFHIVEASATDVIGRIQEGISDIGIITCCVVDGKTYPEIPKNIELLTLLKGQWYYWMSRHSVYAERGYITLAEANRESVLLPEATDIDSVKNLFQMAGLQLNIGYCSRNINILGKLVESGYGVFPDMKFPCGELLYSYVFTNQPEVTAVPCRGYYDYNVVGCLVKKAEKRDALLRFTLEYLDERKKKEDISLCE